MCQPLIIDYLITGFSTGHESTLLYLAVLSGQNIIALMLNCGLILDSCYCLWDNLKDYFREDEVTESCS